MYLSPCYDSLPVTDSIILAHLTATIPGATPQELLVAKDPPRPLCGRGGQKGVKAVESRPGSGDKKTSCLAFFHALKINLGEEGLTGVRRA